MPVWPNPPVEWREEPDGRSQSGCGWDHDDEGNAVRRAKGNSGVSDRRYRKVRDEDEDDSPRPAKARITLALPKPGPKESVDAFPKTIAAALAGESSSWDFGDALIAECGNPPAGGTGPDGSYVKIIDARACLLKHGVDPSLVTLSRFRLTAFKFPAARRRTGASFHMHLIAGTPDALDKCISALPAGEKLSVDFIHMHTRGRPRRAHKPGIATLTAQLVAGLRMLTKPLRVHAIAGIMKALGIELADLTIGDTCQVAAHHLAAASVPVAERAVA